MSARPYVAAVYVVAVLPWLVAARQGWKLRHLRAPYGAIFWTFGLATMLVVAHFTAHAACWLLPPEYLTEVGAAWTPLGVANDLTLVPMMAVSLHGARLLVARGAPPSPRWLAVNYGIAAMLLVPTFASPTMLAVPALALVSRRTHLVVQQLYVVAVVALIVRWVARIAVRERWRAGGLAVPRRADVVSLATALLGVLAFVPLLLLRDRVWQPVYLLLDVVIGTAFALPFVVRVFGEVVRAFLVTIAMTLAAAGVLLGARTLEAHAGAPDLRPLVDAGAVLLLLVLLVPGQVALRDGIDRIVFRRTRRRRAELQAFLHALPPTAGAAECCARAVGELARVMQLRGAALLLEDGQGFAHGELDLEPIRAAWPRGAAAAELPSRALVGWALYTLPPQLERVVSDADVVGVVPVASPHHCWGHLFFRTGLLRATFSDEDIQAIEGFGDQLGLVLAAANLLARTVDVERSLAHVEKLAAIGETAARIAHEIRNPVTAARSLAQQLVRDPASPHNAEHAGLILTELERVERQVGELLRFARREDFRFAPVDLAELVTATVAGTRVRLEEAHVVVDVDAAGTVVARGDRERLRQVLLNLIDNAVDALREAALPRRLRIAVTGNNGTATLSVADNGPGVPADALPQLFEPFFSLKENGTGLGLAIARRTVEAHGGRIEAEPGAVAGLTIRVVLPTATAE
jgi:signal transduction histidine kinase